MPAQPIAARMTPSSCQSGKQEREGLAEGASSRALESWRGHKKHDMDTNKNYWPTCHCVHEQVVKANDVGTIFRVAELGSPHHRCAFFFQGENFSFFRSFLSDGTTKLLKSLTRRRSMALTQEGRNTETQLPSEHPFDIRFQVWVSPAAAGLLREPRRPGGAAPTPPLSTPVARAAGCSNSRSEASSRMLQQQMGGQGHGETTTKMRHMVHMSCLASSDSFDKNSKNRWW